MSMKIGIPEQEARLTFGTLQAQFANFTAIHAIVTQCMIGYWKPTFGLIVLAPGECDLGRRSPAWAIGGTGPGLQPRQIQEFTQPRLKINIRLSEINFGTV